MAERKHNAKRELVLHLLTIFVLLLKGFDKITQEHLISGIALVLLGFTIVALLVLEKRLRLSHYRIKQTCLVIESAALFIMALVFYQEGRQYLPYVFGACAVAYMVIAIVQYKKHEKTAH